MVSVPDGWRSIRSKNFSGTGEDDAGRTPGLDRLASGRDLTGRGINREHHDVVAVEIGRVKQAPGRIETEETRSAAACRLPTDRTELSARLIDAEDYDAVVAAVGDVEVMSRRRELDFRSRVAADIVLGQRGDHLEGLELPARGIPRIGGDGGIKLVAHVSPGFGGMKGEVARSSAGAAPGEGGVVRQELAARKVQAIDVRPVRAAIGRKKKAPAWIEPDKMRVRARPDLIAVWAHVASRRHHVAIGSKRPIRIDRKHRDSDAVADDDIPVRRVRREVGGVVAAGRLFVQEANASARLVDCIGRDLGAVAVNRIEKLLLPIEGDELRIREGFKRLYEGP